MNESRPIHAGYDPAHFGVLAELEGGNFWFEARNALIIWTLRRFFAGAARVLEVGVGTGFAMQGIAEALPAAELCASDLHLEGLRYAAARLHRRARLIQVDVRSLPFAGAFDVICAFDVLEHIREDERALVEMHRALRGPGGIVLTVPQHAFLWSPADEAAGHARRYGPAELARKVEAAGFTILLKTSFVSLLLPAMYLSRARSRQSGRYDLERELTVPALMNAVMRRVSAVELAAIRSGVRFPAGGSQLLVAVRRP